MKLLYFMQKEIKGSWYSAIGMAVISGIANAALLAIINASLEDAASSEGQFRYFFLFIISLVVFYIAKKFALVQTTKMIEEALKNLRLRITDKIRQSHLMVIEKFKRGQIYTKISQDLNFISQITTLIANAAQESVMLFCCLLYIFWLSPWAGMLLCFFAAFAIWLYISHRKIVSALLNKLTANEGELLDSLGHVIDGFKELKLNNDKSEAIFEELKELSDIAEELKVKTGIRFATDIMFSHLAAYLMIGLVIFILPQFIPTWADVLIRVTAAILFILSPIEMIVGSGAYISRANVALDNLYELEGELTSKLDISETGLPHVKENFQDFHTLSLEKLVFHYYDEQGIPTFTIGPLDLKINRGKKLFIVGGNGSGKSTLLKLLTGLYYPEEGLVNIDNKVIKPRRIDAYRHLFSAVFSDFHLFGHLYGMKNVEDEEVNRLLQLMKLDSKTTYSQGKFSNIKLSTGQRKRLALIVSLIEDRDIYVFDEWAADQDVEFREIFYHEILNDLRERGKTVILVTHDDRYWHLADHLVKLEFGRIVEEEIR